MTSWRTQQSSPNRFSPFPHEDVVALLAQAATGAEEGISWPKTGAFTKPFLRVRFWAQLFTLRNWESIRTSSLGWWLKVTLSTGRYSSSPAFDLHHPSRSPGSTAWHSNTRLNFHHRLVSSENLGEKNTSYLIDLPQDCKILIKFFN